jgi:hypothetical protein
MKTRFTLQRSMMHFCGNALSTCRRATKKLTKPIQSRMKSLIAPAATPPPSSGLIKRRENIYNIMRISYHACIKFTQCAQRARRFVTSLLSVEIKTSARAAAHCCASATHTQSMGLYYNFMTPPLTLAAE